MDAVAAELLKLRTLRSHLALLAASLLAVPLAAAMALVVATSFDNQPAAARPVFDGLGAGLAAGLPVLCLVAGALGARTITAEHSTGSIATSLLGVPRRLVLLLAKAPALVAVTLPVGVLLAFAVHAVTQVVLGERASQVLIDGRTLGAGAADPGVLAEVLVAGAVVAVAALFGLGVGAVLRSTATAVALLILVLVVAPTVAQVLPVPWNARAGSLVLTALPEQIAGGDGAGVLPPAAALAVLLTYPVLALTGGAVAIAARGGALRPVLAGGLATAVLVSVAAAPPPAPTSAVGWRPCGADLECTEIDVPLDRAAPAGRTISLRLARLPHTGVHQRIGTVVALPGGPGGSGVADLDEHGAAFAQLRERFDVVSLVPRNVTDVEAGADPCLSTGPWITVPRSPAEYDALAARNRESAERCRRADPEAFDHRDSASVARDVEAVRLALGEPRLSFIATSYGAVTAVAYARLFPAAIRAVYVDGGVSHLTDHETVARTTLTRVEDQFTRFTAWCDADAACALHGRDVGAVWTDLVASADREPIPAEDVAYTGFDLRVTALADLVQAGDGPDHPGWQRLARLVAEAAEGDASGFVDLLDQAGYDSAKVPSFVGMNATHCPDGRGFTDYAEYQRIRALGERISPHFAGVQLWHPLGCAGWPTPVTDPPADLPGDLLPPLLGAGTWTDHAETADIVARVPGSGTVRYDGPGHGLYLSGDRCTIAHANRYLAFLRLPPPATVCRPTP